MLASHLMNPVKQPSGLSENILELEAPSSACSLEKDYFPSKLSHSAFVYPRISFDNFVSFILPFSPDVTGSNRASLNTSKLDDTQDKAPSCHLVEIFFITQAICLASWVCFPPTSAVRSCWYRALNHTFYKGNFCFCNWPKLLERCWLYLQRQVI